jgi:hypothetical protein
MAARTALGPRVETLEGEVEALKKTTAQLKRDQSATRRLVRDLAKVVDGILPSVTKELAAQTETIENHVDGAVEQLRQSVFASVVDVARQWPAAAIVAVTAVLTVGAAIVANWILAAEHLPHIH